MSVAISERKTNGAKKKWKRLLIAVIFNSTPCTNYPAGWRGPREFKFGAAHSGHFVFERAGRQCRKWPPTLKSFWPAEGDRFISIIRTCVPCESWWRAIWKFAPAPENIPETIKSAQLLPKRLGPFSFPWEFFPTWSDAYRAGQLSCLAASEELDQFPFNITEIGTDFTCR